jgi:hydroxyquinol 1,2-dioxygenase
MNAVAANGRRAMQVETAAEDGTGAGSEILREVLARYQNTADPRLREIMLSLIRHLHAFVDDVKLTWPEWERGMAFFAEGARVTGKGRNEFIALSDAIGLSMRVLAVSQPKPEGATTPTLIGPFFIDDAPTFPSGADIANGASGQPLYVSGRVLDTAGRAIAGAVVNVWQSDDRGLYDVQDDFDPEKMWGRGRVSTDQEGRYAFWSVMPTAYPAPMDAALGELINNTTGQFWRPAHLHFAIQTAEADEIVTHIFVRGSRYIDEDVAFGVRPTLVAEFAEHPPGSAPDGRRMDRPFRILDYDFVLTRNGT